MLTWTDIRRKASTRDRSKHFFANYCTGQNILNQSVIKNKFAHEKTTTINLRNIAVTGKSVATFKVNTLSRSYFF